MKSDVFQKRLIPAKMHHATFSLLAQVEVHRMEGLLQGTDRRYLKGCSRCGPMQNVLWSIGSHADLEKGASSYGRFPFRLRFLYSSQDWYILRREVNWLMQEKTEGFWNTGTWFQ